MASLKDTAEQLTNQLEELVGQLRSELTNGSVDFEKLATIADELSERADGLAETFSNVNDALMQRIKKTKSSSSGGGQSKRSGSQSSESSKASARS
jgi:ABC-type transporter Mla subunit MlaD